MSENQEKATNVAVWALYLLSFILIGWIIFHGGRYVYWKYIEDSRVLDLESVTNIELPKVMKEGDPITLTFSFCKFLPLEAEIDSKVIDGEKYAYPRKYTSTSTGCFDEFRDSSDLVPNLSNNEGLFHYERTIRYHVNPLKTVEYKIISNEFEIIE